MEKSSLHIPDEKPFENGFNSRRFQDHPRRHHQN